MDSRIAYTLCMLLATLVAGVLVKRQQIGLPIDKIQKLGIAIGGLMGATFAAKLPFLLAADPSHGVLAAWLGDGKTILWGLVGGYLGVELAKWALHVSVSTGDTFVMPIALAIALGRIGCFVYGCCYGVATDQSWGVRFAAAPDGGTILRHPTQLYEFCFHLTAAVLVWTATENGSARSKLRGNWMPIYLIAYAAYRFASESWRPEARLAAGLTFYQWSSLVIAFAFGGLLVYRHTVRAKDRPQLVRSSELRAGPKSPEQPAPEGAADI